jgi:tetratricopeptide (TPR) repeat protein
MKKSAVVLFFAAFLSISAFAQTIQEGINHLYAERYESARAAFQKILASNPNNIEATYWLGQTYLEKKDVPAARSLYEKALVANGNAPLLLVGMGNVELVEGKKNDARTHFETAINTSRGKKANDPAILNAIGRSIVNSYSESNKTGDLDYAISKLEEAAKIAPSNADIFLNLGNAYRKKGNKGGEAVQAYRQAAQINPNFAIAPFRTAMLYKTQVNYRQPDAWGVVLDNLNAAVAADPGFAPAYEQLYYYSLFAKRDFPAAENYANKYISNSDPSVENDYLKLQTILVQNKFSEAAAIGKNIIAQTNNNAKPRLYRAMSVIYLGLKDSATACNYIDEFFAKASDDDVLGSDYIIKAQACGRNNPQVIRENIMLAVRKDSVLSRQLRTINDAIEDAKASGQRVFEAELRMLSYQLRQEKGQPTSPTELISYMALPFYFGGAYDRADSISMEYSKLAPDSIYGYYWSARAKQAIDSGDQQQGLFVADYEKVLELALSDTARFKPMGLNAASSLAIYYYNVKRDVAKSNEYVEKGLLFDPANSNLLNIKKIINARNRGGTQSTQKSSSSSNSAKVKTEPGKTKVKKG